MSNCPVQCLCDQICSVGGGVNCVIVVGDLDALCCVFDIFLSQCIFCFFHSLKTVKVLTCVIFHCSSWSHSACAPVLHHLCRWVCPSTKNCGFNLGSILDHFLNFETELVILSSILSELMSPLSDWFMLHNDGIHFGMTQNSSSDPS